MRKFLYLYAFAACVGVSLSGVKCQSNQTKTFVIEPGNNNVGPESILPPIRLCPNPNEVFDICPTTCPFRTCGIDDTLIDCIPGPVPGDKDCPPAKCRCKNGFFRDDKGNCVPWEKCPKCTKPNEEYDPCDAPCPQRRCDFDATVVRCKAPPKVGDTECIAGCRCKDGFLRNDKGVCISQDKCPCNGDENATKGCGSNCGKLCSDVGKTSPSICPLLCLLNGCECRKGFYYDSNLKKCVLPSQCTPVCKQNEVYSSCANGGCRRRRCSDVGILCIDPIKCKPGCICKEGYVQNANGTCIPENQCDNVSCGGDPNAQPGCGVNCGKKCSDVGLSGPFACPKICKVDGCDCKDGFYFDSSSQKCVQADQCTIVCNANEVLSDCANGGCRRRKCSDIDGPILCIDTIECKSGCICADGYYKDEKGRCISKAECIATLPCGGDVNAVPGCGNNCGKHCSDLTRSSNIPPVCTADCQLNGCDCRDGYYYDDNRKRCVLESECMKCRANETYDSGCATAGCRRRKCSDLNVNIQLLCRPLFLCAPGCRCEDGFLRNDKGNCVLEPDCGVKVTCGGDENAVPGCGSYCNTQCTDIGRLDTEPSQCSDFCTLNGCDCRPGLFYDENIRKCVKPEACSVVGGCSVSTPEQQRLLRKGNYGLTSKIFYQLAYTKPGVNFSVSAFSLIFPLVYLFLFSQGDTFFEISYHLNLRGKQQIRCTFPTFLESLKTSKDVQLNMASKIYVQDRYQLSEAFKRDLTNFRAEAQRINFSQASNAANTINSWVSGATNGKITNLVSSDSLDSATRLLLANAVYFKGAWRTQFNKDNTRQSDFYSNAQRTVKVDMMRLKGKFNYNEDAEINAKILEMPYTDGNSSFVVWLPNNKDGIVSLTEKLTNIQWLERSANTFTYETVDVSLPKFEVTTTIDLKEYLTSIGVQTLFKDEAQLNGMIVPDESLKVSSAVQKVYMKVDEAGTEAAAANAFGISTTSAMIPTREFTFTADHPFVYCIKFKTMLLFCGVHYG